MTQTNGYWCDECRAKYVEHTCKNDTLPCGHAFDAAIFVYAKRFGSGGEDVTMEGLGRFNLFTKDENLVGQRWNFKQWIRNERTDKEEPVAEWIKRQEARFVRAFCARWFSSKEPPDWRMAQILEIDVFDPDKEPDR